MEHARDKTSRDAEKRRACCNPLQHSVGWKYMTYVDVERRTLVPRRARTTCNDGVVVSADEDPYDRAVRRAKP